MEINKRRPWDTTEQSAGGWKALADSIVNDQEPKLWRSTLRQAQREPDLRAARRERRQEQTDAIAQMGSVVYAVWTLDKLVKIGRSDNLAERLRRYRISGPDMHRLLLVIPGSLREERAAQAPFREHLERGLEFFRPAPEVVAWVNEVRSRMGIPPWDPYKVPRSG